MLDAQCSMPIDQRTAAVVGHGASTIGRWVLAIALLVLSPLPAVAQADISGIWQSRFGGVNTYSEDQEERGPGPALGDYLGLPISDAARQFADTWDPSRITLPEEQCRVHVAPYIYRGPLNLRVWEEREPETQALVAIKHYISTYEQTRTIWMDGRPHPGPNAPHTWMGFSTGHYEGDMLVVETTHLKQGWLRRNGLPMSDQARMTEYIVRRGDLLSHIFILVDPVYLTEPLIKSEEFMRAPRELPERNWLWVCEPVVEIATRAAGVVPAYLPGEHPYKGEFERRHGIAAIAARGGAATMYPEFQSMVTSPPVPAAR
jgi:hypothetical protein